VKRALAVVPLLLLAACGGGGDDGGGAGLSKADYISKAEAVCKKANADIRAAAFPTTSKAFPEYVGKLVTVAETARDALRQLEPPKADEEDLKDKVLDPLDEQIEQGREYQKDVADAVAANDTKKLGQLVADPPTSTKVDIGWMRSYGFKECVEVAETD
jgi:hypothetical protein